MYFHVRQSYIFALSFRSVDPDRSWTISDSPTNTNQSGVNNAGRRGAGEKSEYRIPLVIFPTYIVDSIIYLRFRSLLRDEGCVRAGNTPNCLRSPALRTLRLDHRYSYNSKTHPSNVSEIQTSFSNCVQRSPVLEVSIQWRRFFFFFYAFINRTEKSCQKSNKKVSIYSFKRISIGSKTRAPTAALNHLQRFNIPNATPFTVYNRPNLLTACKRL